MLYVWSNVKGAVLLLLLFLPVLNDEKEQKFIKIYKKYKKLFSRSFNYKYLEIVGNFV